jgi:hypothetical protein
LLEAIESDDPTTLVGLPLIRTCELLREAGIDPLTTPAGQPVTAPTGSLYLMPNALDLGTESTGIALDDVLPVGVIRTAARLTHWIAEKRKSTRAF